MATTYGTAGNDIWTLITGGTAVVDGLGGIDTLSLGTTLRSNYTVTQSADGAVHIDTISGASSAFHGTLYNMETLLFNNGRDSIDLTTYFGPAPINGGPNNDTLAGTAGADTINAGAGNDVITGGAGNDTIDGGTGTDTAVYSGTRASYTVTATSTGYTVSGPDGTDTLTNVERLQFSDAKLAFDITGNSNACFSTSGLANSGQVYRLYQAAFNRTPDKIGLNYWIGQADASTTLTTIAAGFTGSVEFKATYGSINDHQFVDQLYLNVLHRPSDPTGVAYWYGQLDTKAMTREQVLVGFSESNENQQALIGVIQNGVDYTA